MSLKNKKTVTRLDSMYMQQYDAYIERQERRRKRLMRRLVIFSIIALFVIGSMATYHIKQRVVHAEKSEQYEQFKKELASLQKEEKHFLEEISLLNNDDYVLELARKNYFFSKEGELIFKVDEKSTSY